MYIQNRITSIPKDMSLYSNAFSFMRVPLNFGAAASSPPSSPLLLGGQPKEANATKNIPTSSMADVTITGIPYDMATSGRPGARFGPQAIRAASMHLAWEERKFPHRFSLAEADLQIEDCGDLIFESGDSEQMVTGLEKHARALLAKGKKLLCFGGDHFVTLPLLRAHASAKGKLALVHFDAHTDTYEFGSKYDHGTMFYHAPKEGLIDTAHSIQIGIRTEYDYDTHPFQVVAAPEANEMSAQEIATKIIKRAGQLPVYLTFDIDCLDPGFAPGTGTPVTGGMTPSKILSVLRLLGDLDLVGADVVEVAPNYDCSEVTALAAATIAVEILYLWAAKKRNGCQKKSQLSGPEELPKPSSASTPDLNKN